MVKFLNLLSLLVLMDPNIFYKNLDQANIEIGRGISPENIHIAWDRLSEPEGDFLREDLERIAQINSAGIPLDVLQNQYGGWQEAVFYIQDIELTGEGLEVQLGVTSSSQSLAQRPLSYTMPDESKTEAQIILTPEQYLKTIGLVVMVRTTDNQTIIGAKGYGFGEGDLAHIGGTSRYWHATEKDRTLDVFSNGILCDMLNELGPSRYNVDENGMKMIGIAENPYSNALDVIYEVPVNLTVNQVIDMWQEALGQKQNRNLFAVPWAKEGFDDFTSKNNLHLGFTDVSRRYSKFLAGSVSTMALVSTLMTQLMRFQ